MHAWEKDLSNPQTLIEVTPQNITANSICRKPSFGEMATLAKNKTTPPNERRPI